MTEATTQQDIMQSAVLQHQQESQQASLECQSLRDEKSSLSQQLSQLQDELATVSAQMQAVQGEKTDLSQRLEAALVKQEHDAGEQQQRASDAESDDVRGAFSDSELRAVNGVTSTEVHQLEAQLREASLQLQKVRSAADERSAALTQALQEAQVAHEAAVAELRSQLSRALEGHEAVVAQLQQQLQDAGSSSQQAAAELQQRLGEAEAARDAAMKSLQEQRMQLHETLALEQQLLSVRHEAEAAAAEASQREAFWSAQMDEAREAQGKLQQKAEALQQQLQVNQMLSSTRHSGTRCAKCTAAFDIVVQSFRIMLHL